MASRKQYNTMGEASSSNTNRAVRIDGAIQRFLSGSVVGRSVVFDSATKLWNQLLPQELCRHCRVVGISGGTLKAQADSPSFLYELQLCSSQLLAVMQKQCPSLRIRNIKIVLNSSAVLSSPSNE